MSSSQSQSSPPEHIIKLLTKIVDDSSKPGFKGPGARHSSHIPHDAKSVSDLVMTNSVSTKDRFMTPAIRRFSFTYRWTATNVSWSSLKDLEIVYILKDFMERLDELFFFDLLTRPVRNRSGTNESIVVLELHGDLHPQDWLGFWDTDKKVIHIYLRDTRGRKGRDQLIWTLAHEMTHAYLELFSDATHHKHKHKVSQKDGHGEIFWDLTKFIAEKLCLFTKASAFTEEWKLDASN